LAVYNRISEERLDEKQHQQAAGEVRNSRHGRSAHTDENVDTVESLLLLQKDKLRATEHSEKFHMRRGSIDH